MTLAAKARTGAGVTLTLGLLSVPVTLFNRTGEYKTTRRQFVTIVDEEGEIHDYRVGRQNVAKDPDTGEIIERDGQPIVVANDQVEYKYETEYGYVFVTPEEIEALLSVEPKSAKITAFQPMSLWHAGTYIPNGATFQVEVTPVVNGKKKVPNRSGLKTFQLILDAMRKHNAFAMIDLVSRGIPEPAVLLPDGTLWKLYVEEETKEPREPQPEVPATDDERVMMATFVEGLLTKEPVSLHDNRTTLIQGYADEKAQAGDFSKPDAPEATETVVVEESVDVMALMMASIDAMKKAS
jgi:non-homologous end joining protein Ku